MRRAPLGACDRSRPARAVRRRWAGQARAARGDPLLPLAEAVCWGGLRASGAPRPGALVPWCRPAPREQARWGWGRGAWSPIRLPMDAPLLGRGGRGRQGGGGASSARSVRTVCRAGAAGELCAHAGGGAPTGGQCSKSSRATREGGLAFLVGARPAATRACMGGLRLCGKAAFGGSHPASRGASGVLERRSWGGASSFRTKPRGAGGSLSRCL